MTHRIESLNTLRGIAAFIVALDHFALLSGYAPQGSWPFYVATLGGSFGVGLFFLISGFVIPLSLWNTTTTTFAVRRVFRLLPVFVVCCALHWLLTVSVGGARFDLHYLGVFALNISMFGSSFMGLDKLIEPIVWTLAIEVKFYILCALLFHFFRSSPRTLYQATLVLLSAIVVGSHYFSIAGPAWRVDLAMGLSVVPFMFNGLFVSLWFFGQIKRSEALVGIACATAAFLIGPATWFVALNKELPSWIAAAATLAFALRMGARVPLLNGRLGRFFGDISYPLYAVHVTVAMTVMTYVPIGMAGKVVVFLVCAVACAWAIHVFVEQPSMRFSKRITPGTARNRPQTAPAAGFRNSSGVPG